MVMIQYGSGHGGEYRRYRASSGREHAKSCCPVQPDYLESHIFQYIVKAAQVGVDGAMIDTEMYGSDATAYPGPCFCDACFEHYINAHGKKPQTILKQVKPEDRGTWIADQGAAEHYARHFTTRTIAQWDAVRSRCQAINPAFMFGHAPFLQHLAGLERGLGTATVPCLVFSELEYQSGPTAQSIANVERIRRHGLPAVYVSGAWIRAQHPQPLAHNALLASLYTDGHWIWYGSSVFDGPNIGDATRFTGAYGRADATAAREYFQLLSAMHEQLDTLVTKPQDMWPAPREYPPAPTLDVPRRVGPITIDGKLDDEPWSHAGRADIVRTVGGSPTTVPTSVGVCWDDQALYIAYKCQLPAGATLDVPQRGRDNVQTWAHDGVELFLAPGASGDRYVQCIFSARGDAYDALIDPQAGMGGFGSSAWNGQIQVAAVQTKDHYTVELRFAFDGLAEAPNVNDTWRANFCRYRPDNAAWSPTYGGYHNPTRFGTLRFAGQ